MPDGHGVVHGSTASEAGDEAGAPTEGDRKTPSSETRQEHHEAGGEADGEVPSSSDTPQEHDEAGGESGHEGIDEGIEVAHTLFEERLASVESRLNDLQQSLLGKIAGVQRLRDEQMQLSEQHLEQLTLLRSDVQEMVNKGAGQDPGTASAVTLEATGLQSEVRAANKRHGGGWQSIWDALKLALNSLWTLISKLVRVKEWTLTGQISVPGLAGAGISITFGG